jgi:hypothetical protein
MSGTEVRARRSHSGLLARTHGAGTHSSRVPRCGAGPPVLTGPPAPASRSPLAHNSSSLHGRAACAAGSTSVGAARGRRALQEELAQRSTVQPEVESGLRGRLACAPDVPLQVEIQTVGGPLLGNNDPSAIHDGLPDITRVLQRLEAFATRPTRVFADHEGAVPAELLRAHSAPLSRGDDVHVQPEVFRRLRLLAGRTAARNSLEDQHSAGVTLGWLTRERSNDQQKYHTQIPVSHVSSSLQIKQAALAVFAKPPALSG